MITVAILSISDRCFKGVRHDLSGEEIKRLLSEIPGELAAYEIVPDEKEIISAKLADLADRGGIDLVLTTGGTGVAERDVTPEATLAILDRKMPGIPELMRSVSLLKTRRAINFRGVAGIRKKTLIINLPGRPRAVIDNLWAVLPELSHTIGKIRGDY